MTGYIHDDGPSQVYDFVWDGEQFRDTRHRDRFDVGAASRRGRSTNISNERSRQNRCMNLWSPGGRNDCSMDFEDRFGRQCHLASDRLVMLMRRRFGQRLFGWGCMTCKWVSNFYDSEIEAKANKELHWCAEG